MLTQEQFTQHIKDLLGHIGDDPSREGLVDTPRRVYKAYDELFSGYQKDAVKTLQSALFETTNPEMVIVSDIDFISTCEHHMLPIIGKAHIGYLPSGKVVGLSKLPRLVDIFAKRLQIQENMTQQIANAITEGIAPQGVGVIIKARHLCMEARGIEQMNTWTTTSCFGGAMNDTDTKNYFLNQVR